MLRGNIAITVALGPILLKQGSHVRKTTPVLPEPPGDRQGQMGTGRELRLLAMGDSRFYLNLFVGTTVGLRGHSVLSSIVKNTRKIRVRITSIAAKNTAILPAICTSVFLSIAMTVRQSFESSGSVKWHRA